MATTGWNQVKWLYTEFGLSSLYATGLDAWLILLTRFFRMFAYGTNSLIIALFFNRLDFSDSHIGLFMTLTLLGDVALSFVFTSIADRIGRRKILLGGAMLMVCSGAVFALSETYFLLLFAAVVGVISPTGSEVGPFRSVEESTLSHLTTPTTRPDVLTWYVTSATLGASIGTVTCGWIVQRLQVLDGWTQIDAYHTMFWIYSLTGGINILLILVMSENCEQHVQKSHESYILLEDTESESDDQPPLAADLKVRTRTRRPGIFSQISPASRVIMYKMCALFALDSLGGGMTPWSLTNYYLDTKFHPASSTLGSINSVAFFLSALSGVFASPLARRLGLINTMVFTHFPSSIALALMPAPSSLPPTIMLLLFRAALSSMDQAPRAAFVAAVVRPEERTVVMGINSMLRTLAQSAGPSITGVLAGNDKFWIAFLIAGVLKGSYDICLWIWGLKLKLHEHEKHLDGSK